MKRILSVSLFVVVLTCFFIQSHAQALDIRLNLKKGDRLSYDITLDSNLEQKSNQYSNVNQTSTLTIDQQVKNILPNGNYLIEANYKCFSLKHKFGNKVSTYHSDTVDVKNPYYKHLNFLTSVKFTYELSPRGIVSNMKGFESLTKHTDSDNAIINLLRNFSKPELITEMFNYIPANTVKLNDKWKVQAVLPELMNLKYDINFRLKETNPKSLKIELKSNFNFTKEDSIPGKNRMVKVEETGVQNGNLQVDPATGLRTSSTTEQVIDMVLKSKNKKTNEEQTDPAKIITRISFIMLK
jgi:hypothetical protein